MPKVLILYTSHTFGHQAVAENLGGHFRALGWEVQLQDSLLVPARENFAVKHFLKLHTFVYNRVPFVWRWLYNWGFWIFLMPFRLLAARKFIPEVLAKVQESKSDLVVTTQVSPSAVMSVIKSKKLWNGKWAIAFSDYHFHRSWAYRGADGYLTNIPEQRGALIKLGVNPERIAVGGLWLGDRPMVNMGAVKAKYGIPERAKVVLVGVGSGGWVKLESILAVLTQVEIFLDQNQNRVAFVVACGHNQERFQEAKAWSRGRNNRVVLGWQANMHELYAISDVFFTKPGGLSIAEALSWRLPCFIPFLLAGQEEKNIDYLVKLNLVQSLISVPLEAWPGKIIHELSTQEFRGSLSTNPNIDVASGSEHLAKLSAWIHVLFHEQGTVV